MIFYCFKSAYLFISFVLAYLFRSFILATKSYGYQACRAGTLQWLLALLLNSVFLTVGYKHSLLSVVSVTVDE